MRGLRVAVVGAGSWGTTVACLASRNVPSTILWARRPELAEEIRTEGTNGRYLPGFRLSSKLEATVDIGEACSDADVVVMGVPSHGFREVLEDAAEHIRPWVPIVSLTKGFEQGTLDRMSEVISEVLPGHPIAVLTGPNLAREIIAGYAAGALIATSDMRIARELQRVFHSGLFRVYVGRDVCGAEVAGALKNVIAIAAGMADGVGVGDNTRALVITRGLAELTRLGVAMGGEPETFAGLAGMGDLMATCISPQSRNRHVGEQLGKGRTIDEITQEMNMVAEGVRTCKVVMELSERYEVEMPIAREVFKVVHEGSSAMAAYRGLVRRAAGTEADIA
ncbi:MAG: NAD(P)H-dependent glycerol-3-phosphate dehydrogenase [Actinobacteria bacterium ATB1]|nr:NAD(P)H-dependent glycerol-3-phosphate dehydrogenase [Actinobacteria bacterium ATB1]